MIVVYVLIIVMSGSYGKLFYTQEFNGQQTCTAAANEVVKAGAKTAICTLK